MNTAATRIDPLATTPVVVDAATLLGALQAPTAQARPVLLLDCRFELSDPAAGERAFVASHPVGARYAHLERDLSSHPKAKPTEAHFPGRHPLPDRSAWARAVANWGIKPETWVVTLDAHGGPYASRAWWLLKWLGHERVSVLNGGLSAWQAAGGAMTSGPDATSLNTDPSAADAAYPASAFPGMPTVDAEALLAKPRHYLLIDARGADRFRGENEVMDPVAGHMPGAVNHCFRDNLAADGRFLSVQDLKTHWQGLMGEAWQANTATHIVQQCGSGVTACQNIVAVLHAGGPLTALYPGSWSEWSADPSRPRA